MMRYIKLFESYKDIENICDKYRIKNYTINNDQSIDVNGYVNLYNKNLTKIPLSFGRVNGNFHCGANKLNSLKGSTYHVNGFFSCSTNQLNSLEYCPKYIGDCLYFEGNNIYSLDGINKINNNIYYKSNPIEELINLFNKDAKIYLEYLELYNFQKDKVIYQTRFMEALNDYGVTEPLELKNYIYQ